MGETVYTFLVKWLFLLTIFSNFEVKLKLTMPGATIGANGLEITSILPREATSHKNHHSPGDREYSIVDLTSQKDCLHIKMEYISST